MLRGVLRAKVGKIIVLILILILGIMGIFLFKKNRDSRRYEKQTVMAKQFLEAGDYEQAVESYQKAISMKGSDQEYLSMELAEAYIGINDYDKALEVLRNCYKKTAGIAIKEKIEEVTSRKADYEYQQTISRGDVYYSNEEYDKAIQEYEKAKLIKSKEVISYQRIAQAYIKSGKYEEAQAEVLEGLTITQSEELNQILAVVESHLIKQQYDTILEQAEEFIFQENYKDGIAKYQEAMHLLPEEDKAYIGMANVYITQEKYQTAITLLEGAKEHINSEELDFTLEKAAKLKKVEEKRNETLKTLYDAVEGLDIGKIKKIMNSEFFIKEIAVDIPVYYSPLGEGNISKGDGMILFTDKNLYSGTIDQGIKRGKGIAFQLTESNGEQGYYYYQGDWSNDIPNGKGKTTEVVTEKDKDGSKHTLKIITEGNFNNGAEMDSMVKSFYINDEEAGTVSYSARNGVPMLLEDENVLPPTDGERYPIGIVVKNGTPTEEYYYVEPGTIWGVKPFVQCYNEPAIK
ncbi:MAG: tetratricopeptide repeat protein [Lachnospiraceae bacterium]|nr:tetratricopeptide repeat protein [Lachnospiraceae bacterium]